MPTKDSSERTTPNHLSIISEGWALSSNRSDTVRRSRIKNAPADGTFSLPSFLASEEFVVLDAGDARPQPGRRGAETITSSVQVAAEVEADAAVFVTATQPSGAISFHFPRRAPVRGGRRGLASVVVAFDIPAGEGAASEGRRGLFSKLVRIVLVKVADAALGALGRHAAKWAVPLLSRQLEERLWKNRVQGWVRVEETTLADPAGNLPAALPGFGSPQRGLLFIHGTFSHAHSGFRKLTQTRFFAEARAIYGDNIFAFNHFTISKTPAENVADLLAALPDRDFEFDIITHSRGGLVARELLEGSGLAHPRGRRLKAGRVIMVACPSAGTPLGSPDHWDEKLSFFANLMDMLPDHSFATGGAWLAEGLKWVAANVLGHCKGLVAMDPRGDFIASIQEGPGAPAGASYHAVVANYHPDAKWWGRLADMGIDNFFDGANDLVVPTEGGWKTNANPGDWVRGDRVACFGPGGNMRAGGAASPHHVSFFGEDDVADALIATLRGAASSLPRIDTSRVLPSRASRRIRGAGIDSPPPEREPASGSMGGAASASAPGSPAPTISKQGWADEDELRLTVVSQKLHTAADADGSVPLLIAEYRGARVTEPFYLRGDKDNAGTRWGRIIAAQRRIVRYANGESFLTTKSAPDAPDYPDNPFLEELGHDLFCTLFPGEVRHLYNVARFRHAKRRLRLTFTSMIPWVADLPWELAYDKIAGNFLSCADVRFVRNVLTPTPANHIPPKGKKLRILVVSAQPAGFGELSIEEERRGIHESFRPLIDAGLVHVEVIAAATPEMLHERLRYPAADDDIDVLHFIGHGEFDEDSRIGTLIFQDEAGRPKPLTSTSFLNILRGRDIRVVFLNACETGRGRSADYNRGVAMALVKDGLPAVVANQYSVIDRSASLFSLHFYACLAKGLPLGDAMREARIALHYCGVEPMDWAVPVMFAVDSEARVCAPGGAAVAASSPAVLSRRSDTLRRRSGSRRKSVAVWDAENALVYREHLDRTLEELNAVQDAFAFQLERFTAPRGLWAVDGDSANDGVAYLRADNVISRMERIRKAIGADFLFCVTELPLRGGSTTAIYYYQEERIGIFSTWGLQPRLTGASLRKAVANHLAISLLDSFTHIPGGRSDDDPAHPIHTVGFWNDDRRVDHIAGPMKITPTGRAQIKAAIRNKESELTPSDFAAIEKLLSI